MAPLLFDPSKPLGNEATIPKMLDFDKNLLAQGVKPAMVGGEVGDEDVLATLRWNSGNSTHQFKKSDLKEGTTIQFLTAFDSYVAVGEGATVPGFVTVRNIPVTVVDGGTYDPDLYACVNLAFNEGAINADDYTIEMGSALRRSAAILTRDGVDYFARGNGGSCWVAIDSGSVYFALHFGNGIVLPIVKKNIPAGEHTLTISAGPASPIL